MKKLVVFGFSAMLLLAAYACNQNSVDPTADGSARGASHPSSTTGPMSGSCTGPMSGTGAHPGPPHSGTATPPHSGTDTPPPSGTAGPGHGHHPGGPPPSAPAGH